MAVNCAALVDDDWEKFSCSKGARSERRFGRPVCGTHAKMFDRRLENSSEEDMRAFVRFHWGWNV